MTTENVATRSEKMVGTQAEIDTNREEYARLQKKYTELSDFRPETDLGQQSRQNALVKLSEDMAVLQQSWYELNARLETEKVEFIMNPDKKF